MKHLLTRTVRKYIYGLAIAGFPILMYYGIVDPAAAPLMLVFLMALLNLTPEDVEKVPGGTGRYRLDD